MRLAACHAGVGLTTSDEAPGREGRGRGGRGAGLALGLGQLSEVVPPGWQMEDHAKTELHSHSSVGRSRGINQLGFESSPNHLASVAAGPTSEIKTCSSRWKDRQCTICPGALSVTDSRLPQMKQQE